MTNLDVDRFDLGITDNYVNGDPRHAKKLDNLLINEDDKLVQHPGLSIYNTSAPQIPPGNQAIDSLYYFDSTLFVKSGTKLYHLQDGAVAWTTLAGPTGNDAFADSELGAKCSWSEWRGHLFITPGPSANIKGGCRTVKVYRNASGTWTLVQAGIPDMRRAYGPFTLPQPTLTDYEQNYLYQWATVFVREYVARVNGVDVVFKDYGSPQLASFFSPFEIGGSASVFIQSPTYINTSVENYDTANMRMEVFRTAKDQTEFLYSGSQHVSDNETPNYSVVITASGSNASGIFRVSSGASGNIRLFYVNQRLTLDDNDSSPTTVYVTAVNTSTGDITVSTSRGGSPFNGTAYTTAQSATFKLLAYEDDRTDSDLGIEPKIVTVSGSGSGASGIFSVASSDIPYFYVNQKVSLDDGDSSAIDVWVIAVSYSSSTVTFSRTRGGSAANLSAYTTGQSATFTFDYATQLPAGYADGNYNDPSPKSYFTAVADSYGWYAAPVEMGSQNPDASHRATRVLQSKPNDPDSAPSGNFVDCPTDKLTALGFAGQHPIAFARNRTFRIEGRYDAFGGGSLRAILISEVEGAVSQDLIKTPKGLLFASENGFCFTDGFQVVNLSKYHLKASYDALSTKSRISGAYDTRKQLAYFGVESPLDETTTGSNNSAYIVDMKRSGERGVFTTCSGAGNFQPNALHYDSLNGRIIVGDKRGYVFYFDDSVLTWPNVDTAVSVSSWYRKAVVWDWVSCALAFGSSRISKWMSELSLVLKNLSGNLSIDFTIFKDDRSTGIRMKSVRDRGITSGLHKVKRGYPKGALACVYSQFQAKKGLVVIVRSDDYAQAIFSGAGNTAQITSGTWPNDGAESLIGHSIYPEISSAYDTGWVISAQSGDTLTVLDPGNTLPTGTFKWVVKGYPKNESIEVHALGIEYDAMGEGYPERSDQGGNS